MILLALLGCLDELLESPYVLATSLGEARSVAVRRDGRLLVATGTGVYALDGEGHAERLGEAADAVAVHPAREYVLRDGRVAWEGGGVDVPGAIDILGGYTPLVVLYPDALELLDVVTGVRVRHPLGFTGARAAALGPDGTYLVVSSTTLATVGPDGVVAPFPLALSDATAVVTDARGRIYVAAGDPKELWRVDPGGLTSVARWLGAPRDLHFGVGGLLPEDNLYIANGAGTLDYVRPPP